jgi:hypothetical protein
MAILHCEHLYQALFQNVIIGQLRAIVVGGI